MIRPVKSNETKHEGSTKVKTKIQVKSNENNSDQIYSKAKLNVNIHEAKKSYKNKIKQLCENASHFNESYFEEEEQEIRMQCLESVSKK